MLSPNPLTYFHHIPADKVIGYTIGSALHYRWLSLSRVQAAAFCRRHNDAMAEAVAAHPQRLLGSCQLPMQSPELAIEELTRSVEQLGLLAGYIGTEFG